MHPDAIASPTELPPSFEALSNSLRTSPLRRTFHPLITHVSYVATDDNTQIILFYSEILLWLIQLSFISCFWLSWFWIANECILKSKEILNVSFHGHLSKSWLHCNRDSRKTFGIQQHPMMASHLSAGGIPKSELNVCKSHSSAANGECRSTEEWMPPLIRTFDDHLNIFSEFFFIIRITFSLPNI